MTDASVPGRAGDLSRSLYLHPAWALLFAGVPIVMCFWAGPLFIDDAFITFRYAENIARGHGFVYNTLPVLGTTAPFYCLLLAGLLLVGIPVVKSALGVGVVSAAAAPILSWRLGKLAQRPLAGFIGALLLACFPRWWSSGCSGMETTLAATLALAAIYLDLTGRPAASGAVCALLVLTRPDAALLPVIIFLPRAVKDRKSALRFAVAGSAILAVWLIFATIYFGSPVPQSLPAKRLIHHFPVGLALIRYFGWFVSRTEPPAMVLIAAMWLVGATGIARSWRPGLATAIWPPLLLIGLALTSVGPFFWYKMPALPLFFFVACFGCDMSIDWWGRRFRIWEADVLAGLAITVFISAQMVEAWPYLTSRTKLMDQVESVTVLKQMADKMSALAAQEGKPQSALKVYVGETGVIGFELMDSEMIDSAGINSPDVYEIRMKDWERTEKQRGHLTWSDQWEGSPAWSRELIEKYQPDFIASNFGYLHLQTMAREPWFQKQYINVGTWQQGPGKIFVLFQRKNG